MYVLKILQSIHDFIYLRVLTKDISKQHVYLINNYFGIIVYVTFEVNIKKSHDKLDA